MVLFTLTRAGFEEMRPLVTRAVAVWTNCGVLSDQEMNELRARGVDLTSFTKSVDPHDSAEIESAISIIAEHHPMERIWVETSAAEILANGVGEV